MRSLALLLISLATLTACGGGSSEAGRAPTDAQGAARVELESETLDGGRLSISELRGKPVYVNVWASW
jgi:hypothetical protein